MNDETFSSVDARIARLERQNLILKIVGFGALLFVAFNFGVGKKQLKKHKSKRKNLCWLTRRAKNAVISATMPNPEIRVFRSNNAGEATSKSAFDMIIIRR
jgi:hypothetical protein